MLKMFCNVTNALELSSFILIEHIVFMPRGNSRLATVSSYKIKLQVIITSIKLFLSGMFPMLPHIQ